MNQPDSAFAKLDLDTAIRLRWALRDIRGARLKMSPISPEDLRLLMEMGLRKLGIVELCAALGGCAFEQADIAQKAKPP